MDDSDPRVYRVVVNDEEQYSIWFANRDLPPGWRDAGETGSKAQCLDYIERTWTDMRPLSLREPEHADHGAP
jgi:MbtH protein